MTGRWGRGDAPACDNKSKVTKDPPVALRSSSRPPAAAGRRRPGIWWPRGQGGGFACLPAGGVRAGVSGWGGLCRALRTPPPASVGRRQEAAEPSLTWILWRRCGQPAPRCQAPACTSCPWQGRGVPGAVPRNSASPSLAKAGGGGEIPWGHGGGVCFGDPQPWGGPLPTGIPGATVAVPDWGCGVGGAGAACLGPGDAAGLGGWRPLPQTVPSAESPAQGAGRRARSWALGPRSQHPPGTSRCGRSGLSRAWIRPRWPRPLRPPQAGTFPGVAGAGAAAPLPLLAPPARLFSQTPAAGTTS